LIDPTILELMHAEIDGVITPDESTRLRSYLEENPDARTYLERLQRITATLDATPSAEPPHGAVERAIDAIPFPSQSHTYGEIHTPGFFTWLREAVSWQPLRYAATLGCGAIIGVVLFSTTRAPLDSPFNYPLDNSGFSGTMKSIDHTEGFERVGSAGVQLDVVEGTFLLHRHEDDGLLLAEVDLHSDIPVEWELVFDQATVSFVGFRRYSTMSSAVTADGSRARIRHEGEGRYLLFFSTRSDTPPPIAVRVFADNVLLFEDEISTGGGE
jgi:hypothetical protein